MNWRPHGVPFHGPPPDVCEIRSHPTPMFGLLVEPHLYVFPAPTGNGDADDVQARLALLSARARDAYEWVGDNIPYYNYRLRVNDLVDYIKIEFFYDKEAALFKVFWL